MTDSEDDAIGRPSFAMANSTEESLSSDSESSEEEDSEPAKKKTKMDFSLRINNDNTPNYNPVASKLMEKMGFKEGSGLGKNEQGRTAIIEASNQRGRRGLGMEVKGFEQDNSINWDFEAEIVTADESVEWLPENHDAVPDLDTMKSWIKIGPKVQLDEVPRTSEFCDDDLVDKVVECKSVFDDLENDEMRRARTKSNPFETLRGGIFQNRAAMKMANMDALLDFMFTNPRDEDGRSLLQPDELLYFADVCAGPGGFSEYVLWRQKCTAKGFGFTLRGGNDFKLHEFYSAPSELFEPFYGDADDGDIYRPENLVSFREFVFRSTDNKGVNFVMADGGFSVEGQENLQEIRSNRLYLCQCLCALSILQPGGHFVCKLFDIFTNYSIGLIYLMSLAFKQISIFKPVTSRPANSERYIICKAKHSDTKDIHDYMFAINLKFQEIGGELSKIDVNEVVPLRILKANEVFTDYITASNEKMGRIQCLNLEKIRVFAQNPNLHDLKQADLREECLRRWKVPDQARAAPPREDNDVKFKKLTKSEPVSFTTCRLLNTDGLRSIHSRYDYKFVVLGGDERLLIMSAGRSQVFMWNGTGGWGKLKFNNLDVRVDIPRDTILEVELVQELKGEGMGQRKTVAIHVLDALVIYGENIQKLSYEMRILRARLFCKAVTRPTRTDLAAIRVKQQFNLCDLHEYHDRLQDKRLKGMGPQPRSCYRDEDERFFVPRGLLILKIVNQPWMLAHSRSSGKIYYFNSMTKQAVYEFPNDANLTYSGHLKERMVWYRQVQFLVNKQAKQCVTEDELNEYLSKLPP